VWPAVDHARRLAASQYIATTNAAASSVCPVRRKADPQRRLATSETQLRPLYSTRWQWHLHYFIVPRPWFFAVITLMKLRHLLWFITRSLIHRSHTSPYGSISPSILIRRNWCGRIQGVVTNAVNSRDLRTNRARVSSYGMVDAGWMMITNHTILVSRKQCDRLCELIVGQVTRIHRLIRAMCYLPFIISSFVFCFRGESTGWTGMDMSTPRFYKSLMCRNSKIRLIPLKVRGVFRRCAGHGIPLCESQKEC